MKKSEIEKFIWGIRNKLFVSVINMTLDQDENYEYLIDLISPCICYHWDSKNEALEDGWTYVFADFIKKVYPDKNNEYIFNRIREMLMREMEGQKKMYRENFNSIIEMAKSGKIK